MKTKFLKSLFIFGLAGIIFLPANSVARGNSSANNKYKTLIQKLTCPADKATYGQYRDYGISWHIRCYWMQPQIPCILGYMGI